MIGCVIYCSTEIVEPGVIRHIEGHALRDRRARRREERALRADLARRSSPAACKCPVETRIREQIWLKLIGNVAFNPASALTGATLGRARASCRRRSSSCARSSRSAPRSRRRLGIELPVSLERRLEAGIAVGDHKTSMLQDLEAGKPLELGCMTGAVIELAARLDVAVPHTRAVHACAKLLDARRRLAGGPAGA